VASTIEALLGLEGKVAVVTGAGQGIGRACALMLARAGATPVVVDINAETARRVGEEARALGREALVVHADVRRPGEVERVAAETLERFGRLDIAVNNVGGGGGNKPVIESDLGDWERILDLTLRTAVYGCRTFGKRMVERGTRGAIVNIASVAGVRAATFLAPYGAAKAGVISLTQTLAVELGPHGIRVNCVAPGFIATPALDNFMPPAQQLALAKELVPLGRPGAPEDIAGVVLMLASDVTGYVTGQTLIADGGRTSTNPVAAARQ
jgi:NAD(P)-dependent dehydrogenase (short-subunit alcohol dehydrogenase family)